MKLSYSALLALVLCALRAFSATPISCQGEADGHLQGFDSDGSFIYWSMFTKLFKTDFTGRVIAERSVDPHHGDCCVHDGKIYVATQNRTKERRGLFINVYTCADLAPAGEFPIELPFEGGIDGIAHANGFFYVGEGKPRTAHWLGTYSQERTYQCDPEFKLLAHHRVDISVGAFALPKGPGGEARLMVARSIKKESGRWSASAAPAILRDGRLEMEK